MLISILIKIVESLMDSCIRCILIDKLVIQTFVEHQINIWVDFWNGWFRRFIILVLFFELFEYLKGFLNFVKRIELWPTSSMRWLRLELIPDEPMRVLTLLIVSEDDNNIMQVLPCFIQSTENLILRLDHFLYRYIGCANRLIDFNLLIKRLSHLHYLHFHIIELVLECRKLFWNDLE